MFPDRFNFPAYYAHNLLVRCPEITDVGDGSQVWAFSRITGWRYAHTKPASPSHVHGFSPRLGSPCSSLGTLPDPQIFDLIPTLPHLKYPTLDAIGRA